MKSIYIFIVIVSAVLAEHLHAESMKHVESSSNSELLSSQPAQASSTDSMNGGAQDGDRMAFQRPKQMDANSVLRGIYDLLRPLYMAKQEESGSPSMAKQADIQSQRNIQQTLKVNKSPWQSFESNTMFNAPVKQTPSTQNGQSSKTDMDHLSALVSALAMAKISSSAETCSRGAKPSADPFLAPSHSRSLMQFLDAQTAKHPNQGAVDDCPHFPTNLDEKKLSDWSANRIQPSQFGQCELGNSKIYQSMPRHNYHQESRKMQEWPTDNAFHSLVNSPYSDDIGGHLNLQAGFPPHPAAPSKCPITGSGGLLSSCNRIPMDVDEDTKRELLKMNPEQESMFQKVAAKYYAPPSSYHNQMNRQLP